ANGRAPMADLLSTFTGLLSMTDLDVANWLDLQSVRQFAEGMMEVNGGFRGGLWDNETDVEYTFYGLGILSMV
ncbi:MAG: geranyl transferase, partial [Planctomycetota bacterium]|nr:geranyl transferase [Planctomycetota bacterium]